MKKYKKQIGRFPDAFEALVSAGLLGPGLADRSATGRPSSSERG